MKAITIRQPWAWCILEAGKDIENRSWNTNYRGRFLIHTSKKVDKEAYNFLLQYGESAFGLTKPLPAFNDLVTGCIVGSANLEYSCRLREVPRKDRQWTDLRTIFCWKLSHIQGWSRVIPWKGKQGWFEVDMDEVLGYLR